MSQDVNITIQDGALGIVPATSDAISAMIGTCESGPTLEPFTTTDVKALIARHGYGPLTQAAALSISQNGNPVTVVRVPTSTPGAYSSVTKTGSGTSVITVDSLISVPNDSYEVIFKVVQGGTIGTAGITFQYSFDNGRTYSAVLALGTATSYTFLNSGSLTLKFAAGNLVAGDTASLTTTQPLWAISDITGAGGAFDVLDGGTGEFRLVSILGPCSASNAVAIQSAMATASVQFRYARAIVSTRDANSGESEATWMASIVSDFANNQTDRVSVGAGYYCTLSPIDARLYRRPLTWSAHARTMALAVQVELARVMDGALAGVSFGSDGKVYHDERKTPGLDSARFMAARTIIGRPGVYIMNGNLMSAPGSDFSLLPYGFVIDKAAKITRGSLLDFLSADVRLDKKTGFILEADAVSIENKVTRALADGLVAPGNASNATCSVSRTDNISSTKTIHVTVRVLPKGYLKDIEVNLAFTNPALSV